MNCSNCGQVNEDDARFCVKCGNPLARTCSNCGTLLKPRYSFCKECGAPATPTLQPDRLVSLQQSAPAELQAKLRAAEREMEGERKPVTILFTDIVGSTSLAEQLDPEEWKEIVNGVHRRVSQAVYRYEGTIAQLLGDGVLAYFGAPVTHEDDPLRAIMAALDIQAAIVEYEHHLQGYVEHLQVRIGINSGEVVVGDVGSYLHLEYLAIGDAVNLAARLQSAAQPGKVLISDSTAKLVQAVFVLQPLGKITVKGKQAPVAVFEVVGSKAAGAATLESRRGFEQLRSPLVGREAELAALRQALERLQAGLGGVVAITGEAGIGKSRLVEEACAAMRDDKLLRLEGRALSYGQNLSFWTICQLLQHNLGLSDSDPEIKHRLALRKQVQVLFGETADQVLPYLAHLLGVQLEGELAQQVKILNGETLKQQTMVSIASYFTRLAQEQPILLVFDDLHWADPSSLEALELLLPLTDRVPLLLLLLSRLEREHPSWKIKLKAESEYAHRFTCIELKPLTGEEQNRLVDNLLPIAHLPVGIRQRIFERAEGNPLFLEEIVRHLVEQTAIVQEGDAWQVAENFMEITIPETLRGVLLARIDRLQEDVRYTLQLASVIGKSFLYRLLEAIAEGDDQLESHLAQLQGADLVREKTRLPELEYMFKHNLTQEAAYDSLLITQRRKVHRKVGKTLELLFADRIEQYLGLLAYHFDAAVDTQKAVSYLIQAGDKARLFDDLSEAIGYYRRAVEILKGSGNEVRNAEVWLKLGLVYHANFQFEETFQAYEQAFQITHQSFRDEMYHQPRTHQTLRVCGKPVKDFLDPGKTVTVQQGEFNSWLFSGLARIDDELNVIPDVARSWQVLDGGLRYLFHLREDVRWTDSSKITAHDFEWTWKRNLQPSAEPGTVQFLFDIAGAREFNEGVHHDPQSIGVRARDNLTLEVSLVKPVAYFPYIITFPICYPLPRTSLESLGEDFWLPKHLVTNGAYRLVEFEPEAGLILERNPFYHGEFPGNVSRYENTFLLESDDVLQAYCRNRVDLIFGFHKQLLPGHFPAEEIQPQRPLFVWYIFLDPSQAPLDDIRIRQALALSFNRDRLRTEFSLAGGRGGFIPPGMPGHSPELAPRYDLETAQRLLEEAGYPGGLGFPLLKGIQRYSKINPIFDQMVQSIGAHWQRDLGINIEIEQVEGWSNREEPISFLTWTADYPDPDNFLRRSNLMDKIKKIGWEGSEYQELLETAAHLPNRAKRMALYRQADRLIVADQVIVLPCHQFPNIVSLVKPWVKKFFINSLGQIALQNFVIDNNAKSG
jgi:ABC-type oligopeptide transport system substrate-binding subunit/class 3 adenylate cyclase